MVTWRIHEERSVLPAMPVRRRLDTGVAERYREMGIAAALSRPWDYPTACGELTALLRVGYADLPKASQALIAGDVLLALRLLPVFIVFYRAVKKCMEPRKKSHITLYYVTPMAIYSYNVQTGYAVNAANGLVQTVEVVLPKQKKAQAVSEFKRSVVAHKRRARIQQEPGSPHIPHDVLVHIFSFLDMRSLVAAGFVCWSWNSAANDKKLWKMNYSLFFSIRHVNCNSIPVSGGVRNSNGLLMQNSTDSVFSDPNLNWKEVFRNKYAECATFSFASNRALCRHCGSVIWLSNLTCAAPHHCPENGKVEVKLRPLLPYTVADYILHVDDVAASLSDSDDTDSDSEDYQLIRFWM